ncbi:MAG: hypothetical protein ACOYIK_09750 [Coriobacteriales bacterium]
MKSKRGAIILIVCVVAVVAVVGGIFGYRAYQSAVHEQQVAQAKSEFAPLVERARDIMEGTADPSASEERDGILASYAFPPESHPDTAWVEVKPIEITDVEYTSDTEAVLTVNYSIAGYRSDGWTDFSASMPDDKWYVRKTDDGWVVYDIYSRP